MIDPTVSLSERRVTLKGHSRCIAAFSTKPLNLVGEQTLPGTALLANQHFGADRQAKARGRTELRTGISKPHVANRALYQLTQYLAVDILKFLKI